MEFVLLMAGTITHAQRMAALLESAGVHAAVIRTPSGLDQRGCGYSVRIDRRGLGHALESLRHRGIIPRGIYEKVQDAWQEVPT